MLACPSNENVPNGNNTENQDPGNGEEPGVGDEPGDGEEPELRTAAEHVRDMRLAVNIGNSFDSVNITGIAGQTGWGNPAVSQAYIKSLKTHGFTTIRFPVTWADYIGEGPEYTVSSSWMARVQQVVNWILAEDMYCILNVHHDSSPNIGAKSWIERAAHPDEETDVMAKYNALWHQIANNFNYASDLLVLEGMNEPQFDWLTSRSFSVPTNKTRAFDTLNNLNQTFVSTVRSTGGNNASRLLLIPGYWTDIDITIDNWGTFFKMPTDTIENRIILSLHYYTPWNFCGGNSTTWGSQSDRNSLNNLYNKVKVNVLDKGIPVIIGEYAVNLYNMQNNAYTSTPKNSANRIDWMLSVTQKCIDLGICPVLWDTGMKTSNKGMADIERGLGSFNISSDLRVMIDSVVWPSP